MVKTVGKYELYSTLGEGSFGKVKYAVNKETNEPVAIKILDKDKIQKQNMGAQIKKEISIMKMINHQYVVSVKDVFATTSKIFLVLELVEGGELFDKISSQGRLTEEQARFYFRQVAEGLDHCHSQGVCHRDLKPENLLLDSNGNIKISDFGLSALYVGDAEAEGNGRSELLHTTCGTPNYVAPEVLANHGYDGKKADVWSMGVILYVLLAGFLPFEENTMVALFLKIKNADFSYPKWFSTVVRALLDRVLVAEPQKRMTLSELKMHPWLVDGLAYPDNLKDKNNGVTSDRASEAVEQSRRDVAEAHPDMPAPSSSNSRKGNDQTRGTANYNDTGNSNGHGNGNNQDGGHPQDDPSSLFVSAPTSDTTANANVVANAMASAGAVTNKNMIASASTSVSSGGVGGGGAKGTPSQDIAAAVTSSLNGYMGNPSSTSTSTSVPTSTSTSVPVPDTDVPTSTYGNGRTKETYNTPSWPAQSHTVPGNTNSSGKNQNSPPAIPLLPLPLPPSDSANFGVKNSNTLSSTADRVSTEANSTLQKNLGHADAALDHTVAGTSSALSNTVPAPSTTLTLPSTPVKSKSTAAANTSKTSEVEADTTVSSTDKKNKKNDNVATGGCCIIA